MKKTDFIPNYPKIHEKRYARTLSFLEKVIAKSARILDLGPVNPLSRMMLDKGYRVQNTPEHIDLDMDYGIVTDPQFDFVTAFEIFEHLVSPFPLLQAIKTPGLIASVPLKLWFADAYWNENDPWDRHYHEFEPRQFDMLLNKAGWNIVASEKWTSYDNKIGLRPLLRRFTNRYYIVYCTRQENKT